MTLVSEYVTIFMIKTFKSRETAKIFCQEFSDKLPVSIQKTALRKLQIINGVENISQLRIPLSNHLEKLKKDRHNQYSIRINKQWRICFIWKSGHTYDLEIVDYH